MCGTSIRLTLRFNDNNRVLTSGVHGGAILTGQSGLITLAA